MSSFGRCEACGARNTGWKATPHFGQWVCPACAAGVKRDEAAEELARRRALLEKLEAAGNDAAFDKLKRDVRLSIERIERRMAQ